MATLKQEWPAGQLPAAAVFFQVFLPFALGHYLSCLLRTANAVLTPQLVAALGLSSLQLGVLSSVFFFAFALAQLPIGIALDRYGPRRVQSTLLVVAALGVLLFSRGESFAALLCARAIMGLGLGGSFMAAVKAISTWVPAAQLTAVHGYLIAIGGLGAASATRPLQLALQASDWRGVLACLAVATLLVSLLVRRWAPAAPPSPHRPVTLASLRDVYRNPAFRETVSLMLLPHTVFFGIQGLWIGKWLADVVRLPDGALATLLMLGMGAVIVGAVGVGKLAERAARRGMRTLDVAAGGIVVFVAIQCAFVLNFAPSLLLLSVGFTLVGTFTGLEYAIVSQSVPAALAGRAATCLNLLIFIGAFAVQAGFGVILSFWTPNAAQQYPVQAYQAAFGVLVALQLPGLVRFFLRRYRAAAAASGKMARCTAITSLEGSI
ncbi:MFS transporter [Janthinobacterium fluminis]|uniref:MFS transporter n=1 Tax=Janthinobacterium fluminis TaxID=2987524 RepID=A0ABT5K0X0_9BURK|nr:MFS transporter [Janthinobacterium fluminis]MDC8758600.1 MFS transporter [Janthinobacterium fluminis]